MNNENAHEYLPLIQALVEGKQIQYHSEFDDSTWRDLDNVYFDSPPNRYRIKPEPVIIRTRRALLKQGNYTWVAIVHDLPDYVKPEEFMHQTKNIFVRWIDTTWVEHRLFLE